MCVSISESQVKVWISLGPRNGTVSAMRTKPRTGDRFTTFGFFLGVSGGLDFHEKGARAEDATKMRRVGILETGFDAVEVPKFRRRSAASSEKAKGMLCSADVGSAKPREDRQGRASHTVTSPSWNASERKKQKVSLPPYDTSRRGRLACPGTITHFG